MSLNKTYTASLNKKRLPRFIPYNAKIADINEADTNVHYLDLATALSETREIISVSIRAMRIAGTGLMRWYANDGSNYFGPASGMYSMVLIIAEGLNRAKYQQSVANDDFDVYCDGYVVKD